MRRILKRKQSKLRKRVTLPAFLYTLPLVAALLFINACQLGEQLDIQGSARLPGGDELKPEIAPLPFTIEDLRSTPVAGRSFKYLLEISQEPSYFLVIRFIDSDEESLLMETLKINGTGKEEKIKTDRRTWKEILKEVEFPAKQTIITPQMYTTPAGVFDCLVYEISREKGGFQEILSIWFTKSPPFLPVYVELRMDDNDFCKATLVASN